MKNKALSMSLLMAVMAMLLVWSYVDGIEAELKTKYGSEVSVLVATQDIDELEAITEEMVEVKTIPKKYVAPGAKTKKEELLNTIAAGPILKGEQITEPRVTYPSTRTGLSRQVTVGKRAVSIPVTDVSGAGRLIKPGDRVDLLASLKVGSGNRDREVSTVLQNVYVLAVGKNITNNLPVGKMNAGGREQTIKLNEFTNYNTIQVEVDPKEAQILALYLSVQDPMYAILRNNEDTEMSSIPKVNFRDLASERPVVNRNSGGRNQDPRRGAGNVNFTQ